MNATLSVRTSTLSLVLAAFACSPNQATTTANQTAPSTGATRSDGGPNGDASAPHADASEAPALPRASTHPTTKANLGTPVSLAALESLLDQPGPITVESITSAKWTSPRSGLVNLNHKRARNLEDGPEPVEIYFHAIEHPARGWFVVDTGVESAMRQPTHPLRSNDLGKAYGFDRMEVMMPLGEWLADKQLRGVFLTHLHLDHVLGLADIDRAAPIYTGAGETQAEAAFYAYSQSTIDALFAHRPPIQELEFREADVLDVFEDGTFFALNTPGHTLGSVAFVARTQSGPVLFTGDVCHTAWGWKHDVEPGTYTHDHAANAESLALLRQLAARHPTMQVRLGHQTL